VLVASLLVLGYDATASSNIGVGDSKQVAQLSLTNPRDALHHEKGKNLKHSLDHNHAFLLVICHPVVRIDIAYSFTKFANFRFDMIGAPKIL